MLARDYERRGAHHEAMVYWATVMIMTRRLARLEADQPPEPRWGGDRKPPLWGTVELEHPGQRGFG